jgi:hypothetical protein
MPLKSLYTEKAANLFRWRLSKVSVSLGSRHPLRFETAKLMKKGTTTRTARRMGRLDDGRGLEVKLIILT